MLARLLITFRSGGLTGQADLSLGVKDVGVAHIDGQLQRVTRVRLHTRVYAGDELLVVLGHQIEEDFVTHQLGNVYIGGDV